MLVKVNCRIIVTTLFLAVMLCLGGSQAAEKAFAEEDGDMTRGEWLSALVSAFEMEVEEDNMPDDYFADVGPDHEYYEDIMKATEFGVIDIEAGGDVDPDGVLTREFAAHTLAFCLGYEDDGETAYTFSDADAVEDDYAAQIAVDRGWFKLVSGAFKPSRSVTEDEKDAMLADAAELIGHTEIDPSYQNSFTFASGVVVIPEDTYVSVNEEGTQVTIGDTQYASRLTKDTVFAVYQNGLPVGYRVVSDATSDGNTIVSVEPAEDEEILTDADAEGVVEGDLAEFVPADDVEIVAVETEEEQPSGSVSAFGVKKAKGTKTVKDITLTKTITLDKGFKVTPTFKVTGIKMKYKTRWLSYIYAGVEADVTMSGEISIDALEMLDVDKSFLLGYVNIAGIGYVNVSGKIGLDGSFTASATYHLNAGIEKEKNKPIRLIRSFQKTQYSLHTKINAKLGVSIEAGFDVVKMLKGYVYAEGGAKASLNIHEYFDGKLPNRCSTLQGWMYAEYGYSMSAFMGKWKLGSGKYDIYTFDNSPVRLVYHWEDGRLVAKCTRNPNETKYFTKYDSRYGGGGYDGYGLNEEGELVPVFTFEVFENKKAEEEARITGYIGNAGALVIPETVSDDDGEYPVTQIGESAFEGRADMISLQIPGSVTLIDEFAFYNCPNLTTVSMADSVTEISGGAFAGDQSLSSVTLSKGLKTLGGQAFADCDLLQSIEIPKSISQTTDFYIPDIVIPVSGPNYTFGVFLGCDRLNHITFEEGITAIPDGLFTYTTGLRQIVIPDTVTTIGGSAFRGCRNLETVDWPDSLKTIKDRAFFGCTSLTSAVLPDTITEIQEFAFAGDAALTSLSLPERLKTAGGGAFAYCSGLTSVEIPKALTGTSAAYEPEFFDDYVINIDGNYDYDRYGLFFHCENLSNVTFEEGIKKIPEGVLAYTYGLKNLTIPDTVTKIGDWAFNGCRYLENVKFSANLTSIGAFAFSECVKLDDLTFPKTVTEIHSFAFAGDLGLTDLSLPEALSMIGGGAFANCDDLTTVTIPKTLETAYSEYSHFYPDPRRDGTSGIFLNANGPKKVVFEEGTASVLPGILEYSGGVTEVVLPEGVSAIGDNAFHGCSTLKTINIPDGVEQIGSGAFNECASLKEIEIPEGVSAIGDNVFHGCSALETIIIPDSVTEIGEYAFCGCDSLTAVSVPDSVINLDKGIFMHCGGLKSVSFGNGITFLPQDVLADNEFLSSVRLPNTLTEIYSGAFSDDPALEEITIPVTVSSIENDAFSYYYDLTIYGVAGSYAEEFAGENGAAFVAVNRPTTAIDVGQTEVSMNTDQTLRIHVTVSPEDCTDAIIWESGNPDVVSVSNNGILTAEGAGSTTVKVTSGSLSKSISVTVVRSVDPGTDDPEPVEPEPVKPKSIGKQGLSLSKTSVVYTGKKITPAVSAKGLKRNKDYSVSYKNNKAVGKAKVTVKGLGNYTGTWSRSFKILPKKAAVSVLTPGAGKLTVKLGSKVAATGGTQYLVSYRIKGTAKWKTTTTKKQSIVLKKMKKGKKYQVKARAFKTVSGTKYYGAWSAVKTSGKIK